MSETEADSGSPPDLEAARRREVRLVGEILGQVLREAGRGEVADGLDRLRSDPGFRAGIADLGDPAEAELSRGR